MQSLPKLFSNTKLLIGVIAGSTVLTLSACTLSPLANWQPNVPDSLAIENRQLRVNDANGPNAISRRGGQRNGSDGDAGTDPEANATPAPSDINNTQRSPSAPNAQLPAPAPVAKILPQAVATKAPPKVNAAGNGGVIARAPSPTPRPMGGGGSKPITGIITEPKPSPTALPAPDIFDPANSPYASQPAAGNEIRPTPPYPSKPVIYLPAKVVSTPIATTSAPKTDTPTTPIAAPTSLANTNNYGKGASMALTPTPRAK